MYSQSITRAHRTAFVLLIDQSGSMSGEIRFRGETCSKAEAVATITNELLFELIERTRRSEGTRNYYDVAILGYGGEDEVQSLLAADREWIPITELAARPVPMRRRQVEVRLPDGSIALRLHSRPEWIKPQAAGQTPMLDALREARDLVREWVARPENSQSFPPIVFNITDGEATDGSDADLCEVAHQIRSTATADGEVLLLNIHLATGTTEQPICFPGQEEPLHESRHAALLHACSSEMPACFNEAIRSIKGAGAMPPFRGMSFNASIAEVVAMLDTGSISAKLE